MTMPHTPQIAPEAWTERTRLLFGDERAAELAQCHVLIVGLGGVGGFAAELIARAGIGRLTIVDADIVQPSNINRQLVATTETIGRAKASDLAERLPAIPTSSSRSSRPSSRMRI